GTDPAVHPSVPAPRRSLPRETPRWPDPPRPSNGRPASLPPVSTGSRRGARSVRGAVRLSPACRHEVRSNGPTPPGTKASTPPSGRPERRMPDGRPTPPPPAGERPAPEGPRSFSFHHQDVGFD